MSDKSAEQIVREQNAMANSMYHRAMGVKCPKCGKEPEKPCHFQGFVPFVHWERVDAADAVRRVEEGRG